MSNYEDRLSKISGIVVPLSADEERKQREDPACILPMDYHLFLVNEGDHDVTDVAMYTGGFGGSDGPHIELNRITKPLGELKRGGAIQIEDLDYGILDFAAHHLLPIAEHRFVCDRLRARVERRNPHFLERLRPP